MKTLPAAALLSSRALADRLAQIVPGRHVPFLVLRLAELERIAWHHGRRAALALERRARRVFIARAARGLREIDLVAHDAESEYFSIALAGARTGGTLALPVDCRATLARVVAILEAELETRFEGGWTVVRAIAGSDPMLLPEVEAALERGARERERYDFFSTIGHELRTPLCSVRGYLDTVLDGELDQATMQRFLRIARSETLRLARLIDGMFEISLLDLPPTGAAAPGTAAADRALRCAIEALAPRLRAAGARVELGEIPSATLAIAFDPLVQVLTNVIANAAEHGRAGGRIEVHGRPCGGRSFEFVVDDDGPGIAPEERDAVFALGYRSRATRGHGSGLGLALVRRLVDRAGGNVALSQAPAGGTRVTIGLPLEIISSA